MAWIGQASDPPGKLIPVASFGDESNFLGSVELPTTDKADSRFAAVVAFLKGRPLVRNHLQTAPETLQWQSLFRPHGFESSAAFPIREGDGVGAVLTVYSGVADFFQDREVALLKRATMNLAYTVDNLRREQRRQAAEARAHREQQLSQAMLESMPGIIFLYNREGKMLRWNRSLEVESGYSAAEIAGMHPRDFFVEEGQGRVEAAIRAIFAGELSNLEAQVRSREGEVTRYQVISHRVDIDGEPCVLGQGIKIVPPPLALDAQPAPAKEGAAGSGKSSTLAAMIDHRNRTLPGHILTIEDPIEFLHPHHLCVVDQREVGIDTHSFEEALRHGLREAPDLIMIGEIRDEETMRHAMKYAETGHLCLATLHSNNANQAIDRMLNFFPESGRKQALLDLSLNLKGVVAQRLIRGLKSKLVPATEVMLQSAYVSDLILKGEVDQLKAAIGKSADQGMHTFDQSLYDLYVNGEINLEQALEHADSRTDLSLRIRIHAGAKGADTAGMALRPG